MKKRVLIINKSFTMGGIQTALINMLECIKESYEIDLLVYYPEGPLRARLPKDVHLVQPSWRLESLGMTFSQCMKHGSTKQKLFRILMTIWAKLVNNDLPIAIAVNHEKKLTGYDAVICYHHEVGSHTVTAGFIKVATELVDAKRRIAWIHNDSASYQLDKDEQRNEQAYLKMDRIIAVSSAIKENFTKRHPILAARTYALSNFCNAPEMIKRSEEEQPIPYKKDCFICFSASRLVEIKGVERAIRAIAPILKEKRNIVWYIGGAGPNRESISNTIKECGVTEYIVLLGQVDNPYCYMRKADVLMVTSYFEAAPMAYSEAKIMGIPVFTTELSSTREMLSENHVAVICENSEEGIRYGFQELADNLQEIRKKKTQPNPTEIGCDPKAFDELVFFATK